MKPPGLPGRSSTLRCSRPGPALQKPYKTQPVPQWAGTLCPDFLQQSGPLPRQENTGLSLSYRDDNKRFMK